VLGDEEAARLGELAAQLRVDSIRASTAAGVISDEELVNTYRRFGSRLEGHPTPVLPWADVVLRAAIAACLGRYRGLAAASSAMSMSPNRRQAR